MSLCAKIASLTDVTDLTRTISQAISAMNQSGAYFHNFKIHRKLKKKRVTIFDERDQGQNNFLTASKRNLALVALLWCGRFLFSPSTGEEPRKRKSKWDISAAPAPAVKTATPPTKVGAVGPGVTLASDAAKKAKVLS